MKETRFIAQNKEKWQESENLLKESEKDPEKLSNLFIQVVDDLSYSRTYYRNRSVRVYLNKIAREYFSIISRHHKSRRNAFRHFWIDELPQIVYKSRKPLMISLIIFLISAAIGVFSSMNDPQFASTILGERYIAMTEKNIENGDAMAVYKASHEVEMFLGITLNNLMVAFRTYVFGVFFSIGTVAILLYNGIMVGCFQFFFVERNLFAESALAIWLHGTLEISSIILAGGAGLTLGSGLLFPGTYSRIQAFQITAIRSLKLMLGITPIFVLAAIIESFLTRYTDVPDVLRLLLILLSAAFIVGYFVVYPWMKARRGFDRPLAEVKLPPNLDEPVVIDRIKNNGELLKDIFVFYKKYGGKLIGWTALITAVMAGAELLAPDLRTQEAVFMQPIWLFFNNLYYGLKAPTPFFVVVNTVGTFLILYRVFVWLDNDTGTARTSSVRWLAALQTIPVVLLIYLLVWSPGSWGLLFLILSFIFLLMVCFVLFHESGNLFRAVRTVWKLSEADLGQAMGLQFVLLLMSFSFLMVLSAPALYLNVTVLKWNFAESDVWSQSIVQFVEIFMSLFAFNLMLPIFASGASYLYFSLTEITTAQHLKKEIAMVGRRSSKGIRV